MFEEIRNIKTQKKDLRNFAFMVGIILLFVSGFFYLKNKDLYQLFFYFSMPVILIGIIWPKLIKPFYYFWMLFGILLGWFMTRLILSILFYFIITPIGLFGRAIGKEFLEIKRVSKDTYWNKRDSRLEKNQNYEKQF